MKIKFEFGAEQARLRRQRPITVKSGAIAEQLLKGGYVSSHVTAPIVSMSLQLFDCDGVT
jgi:hypothetical protein